MKKRQLILSATAALVIAAVAGGSLAEGARTQTPAGLARQLAAKVAAARTDAARYQAVLDVMKALHVPVFTAAGTQLVQGGKGLPRDFNLYDFELRALAHSYLQTISVEAFARMLSSVGKRVTAAAAGHALAQGVRASVARPSSQASTVGLLVRELGLRHRPASDLMRGVSADRTTLDPLQTLLIIADTAVRAPAASRVPASAGGDRATPCEGTTDPSGSPLGAGALLGPVYLAEATIAIWMKWTSLELSTIKGLPNLTHYGPRGHAPFAGRQMRFGVHAEITTDVPESLKCGYLRVQGRQFPPKGPRPGTRVLWFTTGELEKHGTVSAGDRFTNEKGDAFLTFTPKNEPFPAFGSVKEAAGMVITRTPGGAYVPTRSVRTTWFVEYHRPDGFKFSGLKWQLSLPGGSATYEVTHARKCGDDPYAPKWAVMMHEVADWPGGGGTGVHRNGPASGHWTPGKPIEMEGGAFGPTPVINLTQTNGQLQASIAGSEPNLTILDGGPVTVQEDRDNGAFTWSCPEVGS
jgi:hypothetical protein